MSNEVVKSVSYALIFSFKIQSQFFTIFSKISIFNNLKKNLFAEKIKIFSQCSKIVFSAVFKEYIFGKIYRHK